MNVKNTVANIRRAIVETALAFGADGVDAIHHLAYEAVEGIQPQTLAAYKAHKTMGTYNKNVKAVKKFKAKAKKVAVGFCMPCCYR